MPTFETRSREPTDADALPHTQVGDSASELSDFPDDLMARHERVGRDIPIIVYQVEIGVADTAVRDLNLNIQRSKFLWPVIIGLQSLTGSQRSIAMVQTKKHSHRSIRIFGAFYRFSAGFGRASLASIVTSTRQK
jgi:hypothetical protein